MSCAATVDGASLLKLLQTIEEVGITSAVLSVAVGEGQQPITTFAIKATGMTSSITGATNGAAGRSTVPIAVLRQLVAQAPTGNVTLTVTDPCPPHPGKLRVSWGSSPVVTIEIADPGVLAAAADAP